MTESHAIRLNAWRLFNALQILCVVFLVVGIAMLISGNDVGVLVAMFGLLLGYGSAFRRCSNCGKHLGWAGKWWLGFANPFARSCMQCGQPIRKP